MELEEGDVVLCTVDRIVGTNVFVRIPLNGNEVEGSIITSEIAPGRIRNLRDYVVPKKKIVCKILRISGDRIDLSLRRVTQKEQKAVMEEYKLERSYTNMIKTVLKEDANKVLEEITKTERLYDFLEEAKSDSSKLEKLVGKENAKKVLEIVTSQKKKNFIIKKEISLKTSKPDGLELIKKILSGFKDIEIKYLSSGHYSLKFESSDAKSADNHLKAAIVEIEKSAKKQSVDFSILEK